MTTNTPKVLAPFIMCDKEGQPIDESGAVIINAEPIYHIRAEPIRPNELLYDSKGLIVAIETKGQILAILKGDV